MQGQQRTNIFLLCALFFPEVLDKKCSIVLFFLTTDYYDAVLLLTLDTHKLIISGGLSVWNTSPTSARTAAISHSTMQCDDVVKKAASVQKKGALHVDMVNILWIKRKNHLHFAMQMVKVSKWRDSNPRPFGPEPNALPNCATPRKASQQRDSNPRPAVYETAALPTEPCWHG